MYYCIIMYALDEVSHCRFGYLTLLSSLKLALTVSKIVLGIFLSKT